MPETKYYQQNAEHYREKANAYYWENRDAILKKQKETRKTSTWKAAHKAAFKKHKAVKKEEVDALKNHPCTDCGGRFPPCCMDFDHVRGNKKAIISSIICSKRNRLLEEIAKCELVCANCHRIRTQERQRRKQK